MSSNIFTMILRLIPGVLVFAAIIGGAFLLLWLFFGRKKKGDDKAIGILRFMSIFKGMENNGVHYGGGRMR